MDNTFAVSIQRLRDNFPDAQFTVFTTPISLPLYYLLIDADRFDDYSNWIREIVNVFGSVYDFMGVNEFNENLENFRDSNHYCPDVGVRLSERLNGVGERTDGFGALVTQQILGAHLARQSREAENLMGRSISDLFR